LDKHFAIGNFLRSAMAGEQIVIQGDGTPYRSYLYAADMAAWLWAVLDKGQAGHAYNVGSDESLSINDLAQEVCRVLKRRLSIHIAQPLHKPGPAVHYVADVSRIRSELDLPPPMSLKDAIRLTAQWHLSYGS
jgi:dTDP-glucose 4,6-dehydratase